MNYKKIYEDLVSRGKSRVLETYSERHHIIPKCMGGSDDKENLVRLTPEEHYVAHQLLIKIYPDNYALVKAASMMISNRPSNKMYGWIRRRYSVVQSISQRGEMNSQYGTRWCHNPTTKENKKTKDVIENGWIWGKYKSPKTLISRREMLKKKNVELYTEYHEMYNQHGFEQFVKQTGYSFSQANLVQMFNRHVEGFKSQNGKRR